MIFINKKKADEINNKKRAKKAEEYLKETDWYVIRFMEVQTEIPETIKIKRNEARKLIDSAKGDK